MKKTFQYRIFPTKRQSKVLLKTLETCRIVYNDFLRERKDNWEKHKKSTSMYDQQSGLTKKKKSNHFLKEVHSQVLQNIAVRIDLAFQAFFRRIKKGEKPGYPRFKGKGKYDSITYPQYPSGCSLKNNRLQISKIGEIKIGLHRPLEGTIKTTTIKKTPTGKWFVCFSCIDVPCKKYPKTTKKIGIDVGLTSFAIFDNGNKIENPRFFKTDEKSLSKIQSKRDKLPKGSSERNKLNKVVCRIHERIFNRRKNFIFQEAHKIVKEYKTIYIENLEINKMKENNRLSKSISDVAWGMFLDRLSCKAEEAGRQLIKVNPAYTSQNCSSCGNRVSKKLSDRVHHCFHCGLKIDRDINAAKNIKRLGLQSLSKSPLF